VEAEGRVAEKSRDGFQRGVATGMIGMALAGLTRRKILAPAARPASRGNAFRRSKIITAEKFPAKKSRSSATSARRKGVSLHGALMDKAGWPAIPFDGSCSCRIRTRCSWAARCRRRRLRRPRGVPHPELCEKCGARICIEACSGQAIYPGETGVPAFDREKCVHCGACLWNCSQANPENPERMNIAFRAGTGGLHSAEN
jgi:electron-transferring-flavoprotein dehydrogenase